MTHVALDVSVYYYVPYHIVTCYFEVILNDENSSWNVFRYYMNELSRSKLRMKRRNYGMEEWIKILRKRQWRK
jgi:hypothetical protein